MTMRWPASLVATLAVALAPAAEGAVRYAEPGGDGPDPCLQADPCEVEFAVESPTVVDGDEIVVLPGEYTLADEIDVEDRLFVHGQAGGPPPVLTSAAFEVIGSDSGADGSVVSDLILDETGSGLAVDMFFAPMTFERVFARSAGFGACRIEADGSVIRDSVCLTTGTGNAIDANVGGGDPATVKLRNVTAFAANPAGGYGIGLAIGGGLDYTLDARNVIANGVVGDVSADSNTGGSVTVALASSNYADVTTTGTATSVTPAGTAGNQTAPPLFANAAAQDFHQLPGSPTINAGTIDSDLGATDLDGNQRAQGPAPDIGAYEIDGIAPETTITKGPKKRAHKRKAKLRFTADDPAATFECKLDKKPFKPCSSPFKKKVKADRKHKFKVRATDPLGNVETTPAKYKWKVLG